MTDRNVGRQSRGAVPLGAAREVRGVRLRKGCGAGGAVLAANGPVCGLLRLHGPLLLPRTSSPRQRHLRQCARQRQRHLLRTRRRTAGRRGC